MRKLVAALTVVGVAGTVALVSCTPDEIDLYCHIETQVCSDLGVTTSSAPTTTTTQHRRSSGGGGSSRTTTLDVLAVGDSQTAATRPNRWPSVLDELTRHDIVNEGVGGTALAAATQPDDRESIQEHLTELLERRRPDVVVVLGGSNDFTWGQVTLSDFQAAVLDMAAGSRRAGARFIISTIPPIGDREPEWQDRQPERDAVNKWLRATYTTRSLIDLDARVNVDGRLPDDQQTSELDGLHVGEAAERWFAEQVRTRL